MSEDDEGFEGVEFHTPMGSFRAGRGGGLGPDMDVDDDYRWARRRVRRRMRFYRHLSTYVTVILALLVINVVTGPGNLWVQWVALIWGAVLLVHFLNVFVFDAILGRDAERRMIDEELRKRQGSRQ